ncbi:MAG: tetratricopeptide repeat protein [Thermonemataceae bacterium]|nr:tetratricopeptide repeat protein [Thermonemataceae bacterium]
MLKFLLYVLLFFLANFASAQQRKVDSLKKILSNSSNSDTLHIKALNQLSFTLRNIDVKAALLYAKEANLLAKRISYKQGLAESYGYMGLLYYREGKSDLSVEAHLKSLRLYEELGNKQFIAFRYNDLANVYVEQELYDKARAYFNLSLGIKEEIGDKEGEITTMKNIVNLYLHQRNYRKALEIAMRTLPKAEKLKNVSAKADLLGFIAECHLYQDSLDLAMQYYEQVYEIRKKSNDQYTMPRVLNGMGRVYYKKGNYEKSLEIYQKSLEIAYKNDTKVAIKRAYEYLADLYETKKDFKKAFEYEKIANAYKDTLQNQKSKDRIAVLQSIFDDEKEQKQKILEEEERKRQIREKEFVILVYTIVALVLIIFSVILWRNNQEKSRINLLLTEQKLAIENQNRDIKASILYAQRIQEAILPQSNELKHCFQNYFSFYQPKDIVSGDFYWLYKITEGTFANETIFIVADCTGHGVPGGFMSMIGNDLLDKIIIEQKNYQPHLILSQLNTALNEVLNKQKTQNMDGMEMAICRINHTHRRLTYAGSMISCFVRGETLQEWKADRLYLGGGYRESHYKADFTEHIIQLPQPKAYIYLATDGFQDQLGGERYRKFSSKRFRELLEQVGEQSIQGQKITIEKTLKEWQRDYTQTDDILVFGLEV